MSENQYPPQLNYNNINPKGFFSVFKEWVIEPLTSHGYWPGQSVKILMQSVISGVMDPYRSHIQFEVQCFQNELPVGLLQLDSSAQSFIQQLVISSKNKQIQRIPQYSVLAAWLTDIGLSQMYAQGRQTQGLGHTNLQSLNMMSKQSSSANYMTSTVQGSSKWGGSSYGHGTIFPTQNSSCFPYRYRYAHDTDSASLNQGYGTPTYATQKNTKGHILPTNSAWLPLYGQNYWFANKYYNGVVSRQQSALRQTGYLHNMRAQYLNSIQSTNFPDSTSSTPTYQIHLQRNVIGDSWQNKFTSDTKYKIEIPDKLPVSFPLTELSASDRVLYEGQAGFIDNITSLTGFSTLYSPNFCKGVHQPFISPTVPQCQMKNGLILKKKIPISKRVFKVPLISAIIGILIPQDQFVLLPIAALDGLMLEFIIDKYAMFTSGYNDISQYDSNGMALQQNRAFMIRRCTYNMHTYQFWDPKIDQYLSKSLSSKILLNVNMWTLGNQYQISKGQHLNNAFPVACTSQALNEVVVLFVSNDHLHYSFCRKHFRLSNNVTKFQLRLNMQYFPSQPYTGNGGNPMIIENLDNSTFVQNVFWTNNFMFNKVNPWPRINSYNFAINQRCYNVNNKRTMYHQSSIVGLPPSQAKWNQNTINMDTALGMANIHQNRYVGKAGYVYSFQPYAHSAYHLVGLDCRNSRQFDAIFSVHPQNSFQRDQTMFVFTRSSVIVEYSQNGINVYGR